MLGFIILAACAGPDAQEIAPRGDKGDTRGCRRLFPGRGNTMAAVAEAVGKEQRVWCWMLEASVWGAVRVSKLVVELVIAHTGEILFPLRCNKL